MPVWISFYYKQPKCIICIIGPDVPTHENPRDGQWLHWLVGNVRGFYIEAIIKPLAAYVGPGPYLKPGSGKLVNSLNEDEVVRLIS